MNLLRKIWRFLKDRKAQLDYTKFIGLALAIVIGVSLVPTVFDVINGTDTTDWSDLTGGSGAEAIFELILLMFIAGIVIYIVKQAIG